MDIRVDISDIVIETERLMLRPLASEDLADFNAYASVPGVGESAGWKHHESLEESERILKMMIEHKNVLALYHKADRKVIGTIGMHESWANGDAAYREYRTTEIGYVLSMDYWGQGLMSEAVKAVTAYAFEHLGLDAIVCGHFVENARSRRVIEKCGFQFVKQGKYYAKQVQRTYDDMQYILFKDAAG